MKNLITIIIFSLSLVIGVGLLIFSGYLVLINKDGAAFPYGFIGFVILVAGAAAAIANNQD